jgi:RNA polymerase sigma factor (TIGR02999 family)
LDEEVPVDVEHQYSLAYEELRRLAASVLAGEAFATISPTTLVHEVWLKLKASHHIQAESELHFKRIAARAMRQVLVDAARRRNSQKHGGGLVLVSFDEEIDTPTSTDENLLALDGALTELSRRYPRQAEMIGQRTVAQLNHPAIARFHDADSFADGTPWLAMEYVPGVPVTEFEGYTMGRMT